MSLRDMFIDVAFNVKSGELKEVNSSLDKFKGELKGAEVTTGRFEHATSKAGGTLERLKSRFTSTDSSANKLKNSTAGANKELEHTELSATKAESGLGRLTKQIAGAAAGYLGLKSASGLFKTGMNEASGLEGYRNTLNAVMHDTKKAGDTMAWAVDFANKTPFETNEVVDATVKLQSYGMNARDVMGDIGDMAGVMNKGLDQAVEAVADAQTGELERLKEFGITKQMIVDQGNKVMRGKEIVNNKGQITDQKAFNQVLFSLMQERFKGGMDLQANTFKGLMSTIIGVAKGSLAQFMGISKTGEIVAGGMFDRIKGKAKQLGDTLQKWQDDGTIDRLSQKVITAFQKIDNGLKFLKTNSSWIVPMVSGLGAVMSTLKIGSLFKQFEVAAKVGSSIGTITKAAGNLKFAFLAVRGGAATFGEALTFLMGPVGIAALAIGALVTVGVLVYKNWDTIKAKAQELGTKVAAVWTNLKASTVNAWNGMVSSIKELGTKMYNVAVNTINKIKQGFADGWNATKAITMKILTPFINGVTNIFNNMKTGITNIMNGFKNVFIGIWNATLRPIGGLLAAFLYLVTGNFGKAKEMVLKSMKSVQTGLLQIWTGIKQIFIGYSQAAIGFVIGAFQNAKNNILAIWNLIKNGLSATWTAISTSCVNTWNNILNFFATLPGKMLGYATNMMNGLKNGITNGMSFVSSALHSGIENAISFVKDLPSKFAEWGKDMIHGLAQGITNTIHEVTSAVTGVADKIKSFLHFSRPDVGPLREYEEWMPDMMQGLRKGITNNTNLVIEPIKHLSIGMAEPLYKSAMAGGKTVSNLGTAKTTNKVVNNNKKAAPQIVYAPKIEIKGSDLKDILQQVKDVSKETFEQVIKENFYAIEN